MPSQRSGDLQTLTQSTLMLAADCPAELGDLAPVLAAAGPVDSVTILTIGDTAQTIAALELQRPDVLLLDAGQAPDYPGCAILRQLRDEARWRDLPIVLLVDPASGLAQEALALGATEVLAKPIDTAEALMRVRSALGFRSLHDLLQKHDPLTGLANRSEFIRRVEAALAGELADRARGGVPVARSLLVLDIDRFKALNDSIGHRQGDALLRSLAERLTDIVARHAGADRRGADSSTTPWLARIDGDRFMALLPGAAGDASHDACIIEILVAFRRPHHLAGRELHVGASLGIASFPMHGVTVDVLTQRAELALARAQRRGGRRVEYFSDALESRATERLMLENHLRQAIARDELHLHYQPKVDCRTRRIVGVEALARWQHPTRGSISPARFIPIAEATGLIDAVGEWVLGEACRQGRAWIDQGLPPLAIAVNVSAAQLERGDFAAIVAATLAATRFPPEWLTLELTEGLLMEPGDRAVHWIRTLKDLGVSISLDDFGTGHSSLTYVRRFPIDEIKIDRSFVRGLPGRRDSIAIVSAIVTLAAALDLAVVAEGVAHPEELAFLQRFPGCRYQGDLFSPPVPAQALVMLARGEVRPGPPDAPIGRPPARNPPT